MNTYRKMATFFAVALAATLLNVASAPAQTLESTQVVGKFTLPFAARWGTASLPAGQYTFAAGLNASGVPMVEVIGESKGTPHVLILTQAQNVIPSSGTSEIVCIRHSGYGTVRALLLPELRTAIYFSVSKNEQMVAHTMDSKSHPALAEAPELIQRIPVKTLGR